MARPRTPPSSPPRRALRPRPSAQEPCRRDSPARSSGRGRSRPRRARSPRGSWQPRTPPTSIARWPRRWRRRRSRARRARRRCSRCGQSCGRTTRRWPSASPARGPRPTSTWRWRPTPGTPPPGWPAPSWRAPATGSTTRRHSSTASPRRTRPGRGRSLPGRGWRRRAGSPSAPSASPRRRAAATATARRSHSSSTSPRSATRWPGRTSSSPRWRVAPAGASGIVRADPARLDARLVRSDLLAASGDPQAAADDLAELARTWPREPRLPRRRAEYLDAAGDAKAAQAARALALLLDASDLGLRRALAVEDGHAPLDELDEDGARTLAAYRASGRGRATSSVTVLDLGAIEAHPGGAYTERIHSLVEARDERAVDRLGEVAVPDGAQLIEARTVKKDGRVLEPEQPLGDKRTLSLTGLEPGDFAEWAWLRTVPARGPAVPGFAADAFYFRADEPLWRSVYAAAAARDLPLSVDAHHLPAPEVKEEGGRQVVRVVREEVPPVLPEPNAPAEAEYLPFVQVGAGASTEALARAIADGALEPCRPSLEVRALAAEIAASVPAPQRGTDALPRAAYRRVHELILGQGGSFAEPAGAVLSRGRGSRTVLLKSLLDALGVRSRLALVRDFGRDPAPYRFARPDLYSYVVLRVEHGGAVAWIDPTIRGAPYGSLPAALRDAEAIVLPAPGERAEVTRTPPDDGSERRRTRLAIAVDGEGNATVEGAEEYRGVEAASLRDAIEKIDGPARRQAMEQTLARTFRSPSLLDLQVDGERALEAPMTLRWRARVEGWARLEAGRAVVEAPLFPARLGARFLQRAVRERPLLVASDERSTTELVVVLPPGWSPAPSTPPA